MSLEFVNVYDLDTKKITRIPKCELAPGMMKANIEGMDGEYWVASQDEFL